MKILNFGSLNIDYTYKVDEVVKGGETIKATQLEKNIGGKGLNQSIALSRAGAQVYHAGAVGKDGQFLIDYLKTNGVNTDNILMGDTPSGHAIIQVDKKGHNCIIIFGGANECISKTQVDAVLENFDKGDVLLLQNEINNNKYIMEKAREKGMPIVLNPSPVTNMNLPLEMVDIFLLNEHEAEAIFGESDVDKLAKKMVNTYPDAQFVLTLGENGSVYISGDTVEKAEAVPTIAVDTTAAGDTFTGFFLTGLFSGKSPKDSLQLASKAAAISVSRNGAAETIPHMSEI